MYWPVNAKKNCFVRFIFKIVLLELYHFYCKPEPELYKPALKYFLQQSGIERLSLEL